MIGRDDELSRLHRVNGTDVRLALVAGDPGVGKTMLVDEFVAQLSDSVSPLRGYATPSTLDRPHDLLRSATADRVSSWSKVPTSLAGRTEAIVHLVGPVAPQLTGSGAPAPDEVAWVGAELLQHLAGDEPLILIVDDVHWADPESLEILDRLLMHERPSLIVATYRPGALNERSPAAGWISRMDRRQPVEHIRLASFDMATTARLLEHEAGTEPDARAARNLWTRTGGNPFFLTELVRAHPSVVFAGGADAALPMNVAALVADQLNALDHPTRCTLDYLAVLGQEVDFDELAVVAGEPEGELMSQLQTLIAGQLIVEARPDHFAFRHALLREAVQESVMSRERRTIHSRALDWVLESGGPETLVVHHALGANRYDLVADAAKKAAAEAFDRGSSFRALTLAEAGLDQAGDDLELLRLAARSSWQIGQRREATSYALSILEQAPVDDVRADALRLLVRLSWEQGAADDQYRYRDELIGLVDRLHGADRAAALADLAQDAMLGERIEEAIQISDQAIALADELGENRIAVQARIERASARAMSEDGLAFAAEEMSAALDEARELGDWIVFSRGVNNLVHSSAHLEASAEDRLVIELEEIVHRLGAPEFLCIKLDHIKVRPFFREGHLDRLLDYDVAEFDEADDTWGKIVAPPLGEAGKFEEVLARERAPKSGLFSQLAWGIALIQSGEMHDGTEIIDRVFERCWNEPEDLGDHLVWRHLGQTKGLLEASGGDLASLRTMVEKLRPGLCLQHVGAFADAWLAQLDQRWDDAVDKYELVLLLLDQQGNREPATVRAEVRSALATCLAGQGKLVRARVLLIEALELLANWPGPRRRLMETRLAELADSAGGNKEVTSAALTPREHEVAALVAEGLSNGEIGERLFIARKTVSVHVSNILAKLGVRSRSGIAAWVVRNDVADPGGKLQS